MLGYREARRRNAEQKKGGGNVDGEGNGK